MARHIRIEFEPDPLDSSDSKVWFFAEDLYRLLRDNKWAYLSAEEVDDARQHLTVRVRSKAWTKRTAKLINDLLGRHFLQELAHLSEIEVPE